MGHPVRLLALLLSATLLGTLGCEPEPEPADEDGIPEASDGTLRIESSTMELPAGEEIFWCMFGTFPETTGVQWVTLRSDSPFMHHMLLKEVPDDVPYEDGDVVPCMETGAWWDVAPTLFESVGHPPFDDPDRWVNLPDGVAYRVEAGQRWVLDSHYVNTTAEAATAQIAMDLGLVPLDEVESIAGTFNHDSGGLAIPPGGESSVSFECTWDSDVDILNIGPHMHSYGAAYLVEWVRPDGQVTNLLDVREWDADFRERPPTRDFDPGQVQVAAGDSFRTTCTWDNTTDGVLAFPDEMCTTFGVAFPLTSNQFCQPSPF